MVTWFQVVSYIATDPGPNFIAQRIVSWLVFSVTLQLATTCIDNMLRPTQATIVI